MERAFSSYERLNEKYQEISSSYENENIIERIVSTGCPGKVHYLPLLKIFYLTDSQIALLWIKDSQKEWIPWVENRVNKIRDLSDTKEWYFVPGNCNSADYPTREKLRRF